jgi:predicted alpha/beta-fold hydrolase
MPQIPIDDYRPPYWLFNGHLQTIVPSQFRKVEGLSYKREKLSTPDQDFLLLDWAGEPSEKLAIISHGLEGDSQRPYIKGMARAFVRAGYEVLAWNFRGCGGEINHQLRFYHSGATDDLGLVINHALKQKKYQKVVLVGFSLGGNLTLKYLGEFGDQVAKPIHKGIAFSVPLDLHSSAVKISETGNFIYSRRFLRNLKKKIEQKVLLMPDALTTDYFSQIKSLKDFDDFYTAPLHGFSDAIDYYTRCSSLYFLDKIKTPTLIVNARNDPFLSDLCYPTTKMQDHPYVQLHTPEQGGHVGFLQKGAKKDQDYWSEILAVRFAEEESDYF